MCGHSSAQCPAHSSGGVGGAWGVGWAWGGGVSEAEANGWIKTVLNRFFFFFHCRYPQTFEHFFFLSHFLPFLRHSYSVAQSGLKHVILLSQGLG